MESEENSYLAALLKDQRRNFQESGFNIAPCVPAQIVERYSDRYQAPKAPEILYDLSYFPAELHPAKKIKKARQAAATSKPKPSVAGVDLQKRLQALEETEAKGDSAGEEEEVAGKPQKEDEDEEEDAEELDEEELEEETDYVSGYFDNGEGYLEEEDDNLDDGPVY